MVPTEDGHEVVLGHPSYAELVRSIRGFLDVSEKMKPSERKRFQDMIELLYMVRTVKIHGGPQSKNIYQHFRAMLLLTDADFDKVTRTVESMRRQIMFPRFGIKEITCPICGHVNRDVDMADLVSMVFYHTQVTTALNQAEGN